ncbi:OmpA family protein [Hymenobacter glacieicola]|uniref:OmpA-like domain-containing protein n=1 Tax=Hymenobacter glacieicola TaxID=1562124 RepID=A0ABQ1X2Z6_9BACT|nr:OmpA family protein [Hymenobacter glacieicola]GGG57443.1 hypothetical protein GCM10011378_36900 [Hymenobacter glacieicola]
MSQEQTLATTVQASLAGETLASLSAAVQAGAPAVQQAVSQVVALIIPAFASRSQQPAGEEALWNWMERAPAPDWTSLLTTAEAHPWRGRGVALLEALLGPIYTSRSRQISQTNGVPLEAMPLLVDVVVAATLDALRHHAAAQQLDAAGISRWLQQQPGALPQLPPTEAATPPPRPEPARAARPAPSHSAASSHRKARRLGPALQTLLQGRLPRHYWPVLLLLPALAFGFGIGRLNSPSSAARRPTALVRQTIPSAEAAPPVEAQPSPDAGAYIATNLTTTAPPPEAAPAHYAVGADMYLDYPGQPVLLLLGDGTSQRVAARSTEYQLYRLLAGAAQPSGPLRQGANRIPVDQAYFQAGQATLPAAAQQQLRNLANILRAFPRARIQVNGYSDSLDGQRSTQALSEERARAAVQALRGFGIGANRLQVRASGDQPEQSAATDEAGNYYQPYLSLQFVGNLPAGVIVPNPESAALAGKPRSGAASRATARLHASKSAQAKARRAARLRRLRAKKQHRARKKLWFHRLGQRIRGERASR